MKSSSFSPTRSSAVALAAMALFGVTTLRADILYVSDEGGGTNAIVKFNSSGVGSNFSSAGGSQPAGMAFDNLGNLFVGEGNGTVIKIAPGGEISLFATFQPGFTPWGLAFDNTGNLFAAVQSNDPLNKIEKITPDGTVSDFAIDGSAVRSLAFDSAGNLYVASLANNLILKYTADGTGSIFADATSGLNHPFGLAFDNAGMLYASNLFGGGSIIKFSPDGSSSFFASGGANIPSGLAFDSAGNLYAADYLTNKISEYDSTGVGTVFASSGMNTPEFLAFTDDAGHPLPLANQVPEPSSLLLLAGAGVWPLLRRRRRG